MHKEPSRGPLVMPCWTVQLRHLLRDSEESQATEVHRDRTGACCVPQLTDSVILSHAWSRRKSLLEDPRIITAADRVRTGTNTSLFIQKHMWVRAPQCHPRGHTMTMKHETDAVEVQGPESYRHKGPPHLSPATKLDAVSDYQALCGCTSPGSPPRGDTLQC